MARTGDDRAAPLGTPVFSPAVAVVKHIGILDGFGTVIILQHQGQFASVFSPIDVERLKVKPGQAVNKGHLLGYTGKPVLEGSPPYIHIELRHHETAIKPESLKP
ncbi:MAG: M23 family metallopeptidase [bacterium]|nr:M23 family metallopeptidase [bacterium]